MNVADDGVPAIQRTRKRTSADLQWKSLSSQALAISGPGKRRWSEVRWAR